MARLFVFIARQNRALKARFPATTDNFHMNALKDGKFINNVD